MRKNELIFSEPLGVREAEPQTPAEPAEPVARGRGRPKKNMSADDYIDEQRRYLQFYLKSF